MTPELIAQILQLPLPVRLALLDADPTGWIVRSLGLEPVPTLTTLDTDARRKLVRVAVELGAAWLPCNPLAIVRHAIAMNRKRLFETTVLDKAPDQLRVRELVREALRLEVSNEESFAAAVALLREVVG